MPFRKGSLLKSNAQWEITFDTGFLVTVSTLDHDCNRGDAGNAPSEYASFFPFILHFSGIHLHDFSGHLIQLSWI